MFRSARLALLFAFAPAILSAPAVATFTAPVAINSGSSSPVGDFVADVNFSGGTVYTSGLTFNTANAVNPAPEAVYKTCRYGTSFSYLIPGLEAGAEYTVRLHFAEPYYTQAGSRLFNVSINGEPALTNFDIIATSGAQAVANVQEFTATANNLGNIAMQFTGVVGDAMLNGIEVAIATPPVPQPTPGYNLSIGADRASYTAGQKATVVVSLHNAPDNPNYEFYAAATWNGSPIALTRITDSQSYAVTPALIAGNSLFVATLYLQNKSEAAALNNAVAFYTSEIARLNVALGNTTDPDAIAAINAEISKDQGLLDSTRAQLAKVRTPVGNPISLTITAQ